MVLPEHQRFICVQEFGAKLDEKHAEINKLYPVI